MSRTISLRAAREAGLAVARNRVTVNGTTIRAIRRSRGWPQKRLASKAGCSRSYIAEIELGRYLYVHFSIAVGIAQALDVGLEEIAVTQETPLGVGR